MFYLNLLWHKALDNHLNISSCSLSLTHRSMLAVDGVPGIGSHHQGHDFKFNFCLDSCCTVPVVNFWCKRAVLYMRWIKISLHNVYICIHVLSFPPSQITWEKRDGSVSPPPPKSIIIHFCGHRAFLNDIFCICPHEFWGGTLHELRGNLLSIQPESETCCATIPQRDNQWPSYCYEFHPHPAIRLLVYL